jgi:hypothetical protein
MSVAATDASDDLPIKDEIYNLQRAANRCRVSRETVLDWIDIGLRAFPLGNSKEYRARDYVILEEWLVDFFRAKGVVNRKVLPTTKEKILEGIPPRRAKYNRDEPIGPKPY